MWDSLRGVRGPHLVQAEALIFLKRARRSNRVVRSGRPLLMNPVETLRRTCRTLLASDQLKNLFAMNDDVFRCIEADTYTD